jgi:hypothetical protein
MIVKRLPKGPAKVPATLINLEMLSSHSKHGVRRVTSGIPIVPNYCPFRSVGSVEFRSLAVHL